LSFVISTQYSHFIDTALLNEDSCSSNAGTDEKDLRPGMALQLFTSSQAGFIELTGWALCCVCGGFYLINFFSNPSYFLSTQNKRPAV
jgi:hypothetical protein